jgi:hypothetical protein
MTLPHVARRELSFPTLARLTTQGSEGRVIDRSHLREASGDCRRLDIAKHHASGAKPFKRAVATDGMQQQRLARFRRFDRREIEEAEAVYVQQEINRCEKRCDVFDTPERPDVRVLRHLVRWRPGDRYREIQARRQPFNRREERIEAAVWLGAPEIQADPLTC